MAKVNTSLRLPPDLHEQITKQAKKGYRSFNAQLELILREYFERAQEPKAELPAKEPKPKKLTQREKLAQVEKLVSKANKAIGRDGLRLEDIGAGLTLYDHYEQAAASSEPDYMLKYLNNVYGGALACDDESIINEMRLEGNFTLEFYEQCTNTNDTSN